MGRYWVGNGSVMARITRISGLGSPATLGVGALAYG